MKRTGNQLRKINSDSISKSALKVSTPWATSAVVIFALLCGFLFNEVQPSLVLNNSLPRENSENLSVKYAEPATIEESSTKLEEPVKIYTGAENQKAAGTNNSNCTQNTGNNNQENQQNEIDKESRPEKIRKMINGILERGEKDNKSQNQANC